MPHNNQSTDGGDEGASKALEKIMGTITVGLIFRHFISGAIFIAAFYYSQSPTKALDQLSVALKEHGTGLGITALLTGTLIYSLHRSITNPIMEVLRHFTVWLSGCSLFCWLRWLIMPTMVKDLMFKRWEAGEEYRPSPAHISSWGDYVHLQYTTAIAVVLGSYTAYHLGAASDGWHPAKDLLWIAGIFLVSGFYTDCRKHVVEMECYGKQASKEA